MRAIAESACGGGGQCFKTYWVFVVLFGIVQLVLSQVPSLESLAWASVVGAGSSFGYSAIAFALSAANLPKQWLGTAWGRADSAWADLNAVGNILFAFSFSFMLLEIQVGRGLVGAWARGGGCAGVSARLPPTTHHRHPPTPGQDTLKGDGTPRGPVRPMKQAVNVAMACMSVFYVAIAVAGYAVWGNDASNAFGRLLPDDVLEGYPNPKARGGGVGRGAGLWNGRGRGWRQAGVGASRRCGGGAGGAGGWAARARAGPPSLSPPPPLPTVGDRPCQRPRPPPHGASVPGLVPAPV